MRAGYNTGGISSSKVPGIRAGKKGYKLIMSFDQCQVYSQKSPVHGTITDNKDTNSLLGTLINIVGACCNKEHLKMDEV